MVLFSKGKCLVLNESKKKLISEVCTLDNCYGLVLDAFLNMFLKEDVYVAQLKGFIDPHFLDHMLYLKRALYGLEQAPRSWYD